MALSFRPLSAETMRSGTILPMAASARPSRMAALARPLSISAPEWPPVRPGQLEHHGRQRADFRRQRQPDIGPRAARTADGEDALILRVDVQKPPRRERRDVETRRALHADLLVDREDRLDARMAECFVVHRGEGHRDGNAVVAAERRAAGVEIIAVQREVESVARHVQRAVRRFFRDHVEMALHDDRLGAFAAGRGRADDDDVVQRVLMDFEAVTFCKADAIV